MKKRHRILLIRHARIRGNNENRYIGSNIDEPLSDEGTGQLLSVDTDRLTGYDRVFSGPMKRCMTTAGYLFPDRNTEIVSGMTEMDFGLYEGKNYEELKDDPYYLKWIDSGGRLQFPKGEDMAGFVLRSMEAFRDILTRLADNENAAIVCHGGNIMSIMSTLTGREYFDFGVGNIEGYVMDLTYDGEMIDVLSYERFGAWMDT
ncbi:MAG: histidine phosphatase family protein [Lachnospiraceae bacterium]|nr:histidine phosphatase family protein [Lachnospiraceae bacterium]